MHWLAERLSALELRYQHYTQLRDGRVASGEEQPSHDEVVARSGFFTDLTALVTEIAERDGVLATFAEHEGLLVATAGDPSAAEALAAMACSVVVPARRAATALQLGPLDQTLIMGRDRKLALVLVGDLSIGILAPSELRLASTLKR